jgi:hypothetical protein
MNDGAFQTLTFTLAESVGKIDKKGRYHYDYKDGLKQRGSRENERANNKESSRGDERSFGKVFRKKRGLNCFPKRGPRRKG